MIPKDKLCLQGTGFNVTLKMVMNGYGKDLLGMFLIILPLYLLSINKFWLMIKTFV